MKVNSKAFAIPILTATVMFDMIAIRRGITNVS